MEDRVNDVPELWALRLVEVVCEGECRLVSLTHRRSLASGVELYANGDIPVVHVRPEDERAAAALAGEGYRGSFPGWDALLAWLDRRFPGCL
jgi:hypothetical protein